MARTREEVLQELDWAEEHFGEVYSQNASERAMFGDSGVGSAKVEREARAAVARLRAELAAIS